MIKLGSKMLLVLHNFNKELQNSRICKYLNGTLEDRPKSSKPSLTGKSKQCNCGAGFYEIVLRKTIGIIRLEPLRAGYYS